MQLISTAICWCTYIFVPFFPAFFRCEICHKTKTVEVDRGRIAEPAVCPGCQTLHCMALVHNRSLFTDKQMVKLQESPGTCSAYYIHIHTCTHALTHTHIHTCTYTCTHTIMYMYMYTHADIQGFPQRAVELCLPLYFMLLPFDAAQRISLNTFYVCKYATLLFNYCIMSGNYFIKID